jgi:hypothetical protein
MRMQSEKYHWDGRMAKTVRDENIRRRRDGAKIPFVS